MLIYEVNLVVNAEISDDFEKWLPHHVSEVLETGFFTDAKIFECDSTFEKVQTDNRIYCVQYYAIKKGDLDAYIATKSAVLRQKGVEAFGNKFSATRRLLRSWEMA